MGNKVTIDENGNKTVEAFQEINPNTLGAIDEHMGTSGKMIMHETTEAYEGAKMSQKTGISSKNSNFDKDRSVYQEAHKKATKQHTIYSRRYDKNGNEIKNSYEPYYKVDYFIVKNGQEKIIQTNP
jgi:hypothetical protein